MRQILKQKESQTLEFKTYFGRKAIETLVAFANANGGELYIGISDVPEIGGTSISNESLQQWINQIKSTTTPSIIPDAEILQYQNLKVVLFRVPAYPVKPVSMKGKYFIRKHASNHLMNLEEIANEHLKTINQSWDFAKDPSHTIKDISLAKVIQFVEMSNALRDHQITDDPLTVLRKFELLRDQDVTFGCFLLFCSEPSLTTTIDAGRFDSEIIIRDNLTIRDDLFSEVDTVLTFIRKHISKHFIITGKAQRDEVWEYPLDAIREIVLNMIVHRDYRASADSTIKIFHNRIEFYNPGILLPGLSLEDILSENSLSIPRNKQIASIFKEAGVIEKYGSGIKRVRQTMKEVKAAPPQFEIIGNFFKVTLFPSGVNGGVNDLLVHIQSNPGQKTDEIKQALQIPQCTIERYFKKLRDTNKIEFSGPAKTGGYFFIPLETEHK